MKAALLENYFMYSKALISSAAAYMAWATSYSVVGYPDNDNGEHGALCQLIISATLGCL
jgi:hypothetical protein